MFNLEYAPDLIYGHYILRSTHETLNQRYQQQQGDSTISLLEGVLTKLSDTAKELGDNIEADRDFGDTLKKFILLAYSATGNGYYLVQKGFLKL